MERFISGYLDKVVTDCQKPYNPLFAISHYKQYGFDCEKHQDLEAFVSFLETVPKMEGHFAPQTPLCNVEVYPYTDIIFADENMNLRLKALSTKLGVEHPLEDRGTSSH